MQISSDSGANIAIRSPLSTALPPLLRARPLRGLLIHLFLSMGLATAVAGSVWGSELRAAGSSTEADAVPAAQEVDAPVDPESAARAAWRDFMAHNPMPTGGCFHASYPSIVWERLDCKMDPPRVHPTHVIP